MTPYDNLVTVTVNEGNGPGRYDVCAGFAFAPYYKRDNLSKSQAQSALNFLVCMMHKSVMAPTVIGELTAILAQEAKQ
jgi:hypothetical protein